MKSSLRKIHRWSSFFILVFLIFYCISGLLLNHKKVFKFLKTEVLYVKTVPQTNPKPIINIIKKYEKFIPEKDKPRAIVIDKNGKLYFLFGSMKKLAFQKAYFINPLKGQLEKVEKIPVEPLYLMKNFHKSHNVKKAWIFISDLLTFLIIISCISGLLIIHWRKSDYYVLIAGALVLLISFFLFYSC